MKILHIHPAMRGGGIEAIICGLANEMSKGHDVTVCSIFSPREDDVFWNRLNSKITRITLGKQNVGISIKVILQIRSLIRKGEYDIVNFHGFFYYYVLSVYTLKGKTRFFYTVHSDAKMENGSWERFVYPLKKLSFIKGIVNPITISKASNDSFKQVYGISGNVIENGIPRPIISNSPNLIDEVRVSRNTKVFLHPGRITKAKNQVVLCQVFDQLVKEGYDVVLVIAGSKQEEEIFEEMKPYFSNRIKYVGERNDITNLLSRCDGMCLPSIWEGLPVTLLEALSVGCVPICSPVGGIVNVIHDMVNGLLSKSSRYDDYLVKIKEFLNLPKPTIVSLKKEAQDSFAPYDIVSTAKNYLALYREKINNE